MAKKKDYKEYLVGQLSILENIVCRPMMGEYLLYYDDILFGGIYDNRLLIKIVEGNQKYELPSAIPYEGAKSMYEIEDLDNQELIRDIVLDTCKCLPKKGDKKSRK